MHWFNSNTPDKNDKQPLSFYSLFLIGFVKVISVQNQLPVNFAADLVYSKILKNINSLTTNKKF